ncbi:apolipoprotein N-acyltransferase [Nocardioides bruguierae]|uniref:Apolipoprotein N-acyltransferase n=1 Tax=Nocardioides bruguierae TaxID=2945102 RepID=A0A9X2D661_9ACTN|nr:apolipoprotein N-acyltransferase [Nocardioides bruguierae]MCM0619004.1 apolipoprotein N-acyltransferase [Nocardioides bruguierae]
MRRLLAAAAAGLALSLAFDPVGLALVVPLAVAAFVLTCRGVRLRRGFLTGLVFGACFYFTHIFWMTAVAVPAWLGLAALETFFIGLTGAAAAALTRHRWWPLTVALAWVALENLRSTWPFSGMPWGRLAFASVDTPLERLLPWIGMVGVSLVWALAATALAAAVVSWQARSRAGVRGARRVREALVRPAAGLASLAVLTTLAVLVPWQGDVVDTAEVAVVQGDVPGDGTNVLNDFRQVTRNQADETVALAAQVAAGEAEQPDLVVWPENSTAVDPFYDTQTHAQIERAVAAIGAPVLVGAMVDDGDDYVLNQGIVWDPETGAGDRYTKWHPVPYGEYIPLRRYADFTFGELRTITRDMRPGTRTDPLDADGLLVADLICFDVAYDDTLQAQVSNGAQLITVQTSNAMFINTHQLEQQFAITRLRAIEAGRWLAVASVNGISGIVAPDGSVVATTPKRTKAVMTAQVGLVDDVSPGIRVGPWLTRGAAAATVLALLLALGTDLRRRRGSSPVPQETTDGPGDGLTDAAEPRSGDARTRLTRSPR